MRFDALHLKAFGPFSDTSFLIEKNGDPDLTIIYGQNEAGKSTLLRAIDNALFSIPRTFSDDFVHRKNDIRVGATLSQGDQTLSFLRKSGAKNTLLDSQTESVLAENSLEPFLQNTDRAYFTQMFGLNTKQLREGAQAILSGEGSVGEILFSASKGGSSVTHALKDLNEQADLLFKSRRSQNLKIYQLIAQITAAKKQLKEDTLNPADYIKCQKECQKLQEQLAKIDASIVDNERRLLHLQSIEKAIPIHSRYLRAMGELEAFKLPELPSDFAAQIRKAYSDYQTSSTQRTSAQSALDSTRSQLTQLPDVTLTAESLSQIDALKDREELHKSHLSQASDIEQKLIDHQEAIQAQLADLNLSSTQDLPPLPSKSEEQTLKRTLEEQAEAENEQKQLQQALAKQAVTIETLREKLATLGTAENTQALKSLHEQALVHQQDRQANRRLPQAIEQNEQAIANLRSQLGFEGD